MNVDIRTNLHSRYLLVFFLVQDSSELGVDGFFVRGVDASFGYIDCSSN